VSVDSDWAGGSTGYAVAGFLGQPDDAPLIAQAEQHVTVVTAMARAYTRGRGFDAYGEPCDEIAAAIVTAAARLLANPEQVSTEVGSVRVRGGWQGWNLAEQTVLNRYRVRAQ
jgi:hypothetical protein